MRKAVFAVVSRKKVVSDDFQISGLKQSKKEQVWGLRRREIRREILSSIQV